MKKALLSLALAAVTVSSAFAALPSATTKFVKNFPAKADGSLGSFWLCEAHEADRVVYDSDGTQINGKHCEPNACWTGLSNRFDPNCNWVQDTESEDGQVIKAVPGILCLGERTELEGESGDVISHHFDCNDFICIPANCMNPVIQVCRLTKKVGKSEKCPATYSERFYYFFGAAEIRTWWTLLYTSPGTQFTLELRGVCQDGTGRPQVFENNWRWEVIATFESVIAAIDTFHTFPVGTCEVPCFSSETMYEAVRNQVSALAVITDDGFGEGIGTFCGTLDAARRAALVKAQDKLIQLEATIVGFSSFTDCFVAEECFSGTDGIPGDDISFGDFGYTGMVDTIENPCVCKLIADLEFIGKELCITRA